MARLKSIPVAVIARSLAPCSEVSRDLVRSDPNHDCEQRIERDWAAAAANAFRIVSTLVQPLLARGHVPFLNDSALRKSYRRVMTDALATAQWRGVTLCPDAVGCDRCTLANRAAIVIGSSRVPFDRSNQS